MSATILIPLSITTSSFSRCSSRTTSIFKPAHPEEQAFILRASLSLLSSISLTLSKVFGCILTFIIKTSI
ncbi:hypothetical protein [Clostridium perfringens str. 13]|uniref:Uncharacterized protein n=1 Tax=Clostridium perfringens (strain 13 / Type A) TaxID=195102 RepID=Q8XP31_CLOPE|nr:hypothetical protein [Clostridium perfringens str. 13]